MKQVKQEGRLSRWSRRKQQTTEQTLEEDLALQLAEQDLVEVDLPATVAGQDAQEAEASEAVLTDTDMPAIESLSEDSNFSQFMSSGVSDELRNLALRKMFKAPFFNIRDGLDEYDEDFTTFEKLGDIVTCDMRHQMEVEAKKKLEAEAKEIAESGAGEESESTAIDEDEDEEADIDESRNLIVDAEYENAELTDRDVETKPEPSLETALSNQ
jgi:hypothetical protein